jgi:NAD-dependent dihydropyrimidine dehydrogenase PreA subunit
MRNLTRRFFMTSIVSKVTLIGLALFTKPILTGACETGKCTFDSLAAKTVCYVIDCDECDACGTCERECPYDAILPSSECYMIDQDKCICCGNCYTACPRGAIKAVA